MAQVLVGKINSYTLGEGGKWGGEGGLGNTQKGLWCKRAGYLKVVGTVPMVKGGGWKGGKKWGGYYNRVGTVWQGGLALA